MSGNEFDQTARESRKKQSPSHFISRDWAWEYLRRNAHFVESWFAAHPKFEIVSKVDSVTTLRTHASTTELNPWGVLYADPPTVAADAAAVIWQPQLCSDVLWTVTEPYGTRAGVNRFCLREMNVPSLLLLASDAIQNLLFLGSGRGVQLVAHGASLLEPVHMFVNAAPVSKKIHRQFMTLSCFNDLRLRGRVMPSHRPRASDSLRLRRALIALDGCLSGLSNYEIAISLYGERHVKAGWSDPERYFYDHVRKLIGRGKTLMNGGYLRYLR
jgi:hypothetical protein